MTTLSAVSRWSGGEIPASPQANYVYVRNGGSTAINRGEAVVLAGTHENGSVVERATAASTRRYGIALDDIPVGKSGRVCIYGVFVRAKAAANTVAAGDRLVTAADGELATGVTDGQIIGQAITNAYTVPGDTQDYVDVLVFWG